MSKYLELVEGSFNESHFNKQTSQNPYVAYSIGDDKVIYSINGNYEPNVDLTSPYIMFKAQEANSTIGLEQLSTYQTMEYSTDTLTWNTFDTTTNISLNNGDKLYVRGILSFGDGDVDNFTQFKMSGKIAASGNCNAIWNYEDLSAPLKQYCGYYMFCNCSSLTTAPKLPATELAEGCYSYMFQSCTSLNYIKCLAIDISASNCTAGWVFGVASNGTFVKHPDMNDWIIGTGGIPIGWEIKDYEG
jgi:hypothetical protein